MVTRIVSIEEIAESILAYKPWQLDDVIKFRPDWVTVEGTDLLLVHHSDYLKSFDTNPFSLKERAVGVVKESYPKFEVVPSDELRINSIDSRYLKGRRERKEKDDHLRYVLGYYDDEGLPTLLHWMLEEGTLYVYGEGFSHFTKEKYAKEIRYVKQRTTRHIRGINKNLRQGTLL